MSGRNPFLCYPGATPSANKKFFGQGWRRGSRNLDLGLGMALRISGQNGSVTIAKSNKPVGVHCQ